MNEIQLNVNLKFEEMKKLIDTNEYARKKVLEVSGEKNTYLFLLKYECQLKKLLEGGCNVDVAVEVLDNMLNLPGGIRDNVK